MAKKKSSSSSSNSSARSPESDKKSKKKRDKKAKKKEDKQAKRDKKVQKCRERAETWSCDREDAVKLVKQLLELDAEIAAELSGTVFAGLDAGEVVRIEGLENKLVKKKLRHLLQALLLVPGDGGQGWKSPDRKVSFQAVFASCVTDAKIRLGISDSKIDDSRIAARSEARSEARRKYDVGPKANEGAEPTSRSGASTEEQPAEIASALPAEKRRVGPQLPSAMVGNSGAGEDSGSDASEDDVGPHIEGEERQGVDLNDFQAKKRKRDVWMTQVSGNVEKLFGDLGSKKADKFEVSRSAQEKYAFEEAFKARGPSLMEQTKKGVFAEHADTTKTMRSRNHAESQEAWGVSEKEQAQPPGARARERPGFTPSRLNQPFDPEKDMATKRPMAGSDFEKLLQNSQDAISGRFARGAVATSFL